MRDLSPPIFPMLNHVITRYDVRLFEYGESEFLAAKLTPEEFTDDSPSFDWDEHANLFIEFCHLEQNSRSILEFASRYTILGDDWFGLSGTEGMPIIQWEETVEPIYHWITHISSMKYVFDLWTTLTNLKDPRQFDAFFQWKDDELIIHPPYFREGSWSRREYESAGWTWGDSIERGWTQVHDILRTYLGSISPLLQMNMTTYEVNLAFVPSDLIHGLWLQLAKVISNGHRIFSCPYCGEVVVIGERKEGKRARREKSNLEVSETCAKSSCRGKRFRAERKKQSLKTL